MGEFGEREWGEGQNLARVPLGQRMVRIYGAFLIAVFGTLIPLTIQAAEGHGVAVLPFAIFAPQPLDHLKEGLQTMFSSRLSEKGVPVLDPAVVNKHPQAFRPELDSNAIYALGKDLGAAWVIRGSLTQVGTQISLDLKVFDVTAAKPPFSIYSSEEGLDRLGDAVERASISIFNQIMGVVQIDSIHVRGNKRVESEAILAVIGSQPGDRLDYDQLDKDLRSIFKMGFFRDVKIETADGPKGKIVTFDVTEKPSVTIITFRGIKAVKEEELREEVGIKLYTILNRNEIKQSINRLREFYRQKGYYNVRIKETLKELPKNEVSLIYDIDEGDKVYVRKIQFEGNEKFDDRRLKKVMETSEKGFFSFITKSGLLDTKKLEFDTLKIASFYHNHGYIKAVVGDPDIQYDPDRGLIITIEIVEGPQYAVSDVKVEGDLILPVDILLAELNIGKEEYFNREVVRQDTLRLTEIYADEGYAYAEVVPMTAEDPENHLIAITYKITKGKKVRFERINITGNNITRDKVIRRELCVIEGEYFSAKELQRSTSNLNRLGFFEDLEVQTKKGSREDLMVLDINVKERRTGAFSVGLGYSTFDNVMGTFQISETNFRGYGQTLSAAARLGSRTTEFDIRFTEPWLFDKPISAGFGVYSWTREYDEYTRDSLGGLVRFGFRLPFEEENVNKIWATYSYDDTDVTDVAPYASLNIRDQQGTTITSSVIVRLNRDSRDKRWFTRKGSVNDFRIQHAGGPLLGGDAAFDKIEAQTTWFFPMPWKTSFLVQGRGGYAFEREDGGLPIYQKFRIGGINTVRGFESFSISPEDPLTGDRVGGETMFVANFEYRFPLVQEQGVGGVVFIDVGNVWSSDPGVQNFGLKKSVGAGIRWYSPVGPLRLEWAKIIDEQPEDEAAVFNFNVGGEF